jgi:hypothetical protein
MVAILALWAIRFPMGLAVRRIFTGNSFQLGGFRVPIPLEWHAKCDTDGKVCVLVTFSPLVTFGKYETVDIGFHVVNDSPPANDLQWSQSVVDRLSREGYAVTDKSALQVASIPTTCFEADLAKDPRNKTIFCNVEKRMVVAFHYRGKEQRDRFYAILRGIK